MYVISTSRRPVPLEHFLFAGSGMRSKDALFQILEKDSRVLNQAGYLKAKEFKEAKLKKHQTPGRPHVEINSGARLTFSQEATLWTALVEQLRITNKLPAIGFVFGRRRIQDLADRLASLNLNTREEQHRVHIFLERALSKLKAHDRALPQVQRLGQLLRQGIATHHSGMLPIMKETVEMLFQDGLVKLLFATETFAMGVNMPARTVIFDALCKYDNIGMRDLVPGEYCQMAGRAGRRGKDLTGTVIVLCKGDALPDKSLLDHLILGKPTALESRFRITYAMILRNKLRPQQAVTRALQQANIQTHNLSVDRADSATRHSDTVPKTGSDAEAITGAAAAEDSEGIKHMLRASFAQRPQAEKREQIKGKLLAAMKERDNVHSQLKSEVHSCRACGEDRLADYASAWREYVETRAAFMWHLTSGNATIASLKLLVPGRCVRVITHADDETLVFQVAVVLSVHAASDGKLSLAMLTSNPSLKLFELDAETPCKFARKISSPIPSKDASLVCVSCEPKAIDALLNKLLKLNKPQLVERAVIEAAQARRLRRGPDDLDLLTGDEGLIAQELSKAVRSKLASDQKAVLNVAAELRSLTSKRSEADIDLSDIDKCLELEQRLAGDPVTRCPSFVKHRDLQMQFHRVSNNINV